MSDAGHPGQLAVAAVRTLSPYIPGKPISELEREYGLHDIIKLASNENPWGPSPAAVAAMQAQLAQVRLYPDGSAHELKLALAQHLGVAPACLTLGNGSNDLLALLAEAFLTPATNAVYSQYGFAIYPLVITQTGARTVEVPALRPDDAHMPYGHDLPAMAAAVDADTRLVFIANPNNPTGTWVDPGQVRRFIEQAPASTLVVLDEAYLEYALEAGRVESALQWQAQYPNLVVLRTFSKAYGLAGARVGYAISHPEVADVLNRLRLPFNVNSLAQAGARAALADQAYMRRVVTATVEQLQRTQVALDDAGFASAPSAANFLLVRVGPRAPQAFEALLRAGVIVRPVAGYGLGQHLRVSIGLPQENERMLAALSAWAAGAGVEAPRAGVPVQGMSGGGQR